MFGFRRGGLVTGTNQEPSGARVRLSDPGVVVVKQECLHCFRMVERSCKTIDEAHQCDRAEYQGN